MDTRIINDHIEVYVEYFKWNESLVNYYFSRKSNSEIFLFIDKTILADIGEQNNIKLPNIDDYEKHFKHSVVTFCSTFYSKNILRAAIKMMEDNKFYAMGLDKRAQTNNGKARLFDLPFLNIILYVILTIENKKDGSQKWENVYKELDLGNGETLDQSVILELWKSLNAFNGNFDKDASVFDRSESERNDYVGRILYHLPLSASTKNKIQDAIYKSGAWKQIDSKPFLDLVSIILHSLKDVKANEELKDFLLNCYTSNDYKGVSARKIQSAIDDFDIEIYKHKLSERKKSIDFVKTLICGEFALGIYFPDNNEIEDNSIVLLTTVQQSIKEGCFTIEEGKSGTLAGYNTSFVKYKNSKSVALKDYSLQTSTCNIKPLLCENVVIFYKYDDSLFIQTREIRPAESYIIAVDKNYIDSFESWCLNNNNNVTKWSFEDTKDFFGENWVVYYIDGKLNGQFYQDHKDINDGSTVIVMKGGIKKNIDTYFVNSLPYFEVPEKYNIDDVDIYINLNGCEFVDYQKRVLDRKIIIEIKDMPIECGEIAYIDICIECKDHTRFCYTINVSGQSISYNSEKLYKYNNWGIISTEENPAYSSNFITKKYQSGAIKGLFKLEKEGFCSISDDFYFTNLLAACCYNCETSEITHNNFRKCVSYAATRLNIDIQRDGFIGNVKKVMDKAGILNINYTNSKCQAIPPSFIKIPFSIYQINGSQLYMLCGCYTRSFIADLDSFCKDRNVGMYLKNNDNKKNEERLLPPIVFLAHNFDPKQFKEFSNQMFDINEDYDFALSLLNVTPEYDRIKSLFDFQHTNANIFLSLLETPLTDLFPRMRLLKNERQRKWYIENDKKMFAEVKQGFNAWASLFCHHEKNVPMVIVQNNSVLLPSSMWLPNYIQRALYLMNLGLPETQKVFVCGNFDNSYYTLMNKYKLYRHERCEVLASKISGNSIAHVRDSIVTSHKMEFWKSPINGSKYREKYLVLYDKNSVDILAVVYKHEVFLNSAGIYKKIDSSSVNKVITFLIGNEWKFGPGRRSIGRSRQGGLIYEKVYDVTSECIVKPEASNYIREVINII